MVPPWTGMSFYSFLSSAAQTTTTPSRLVLRGLTEGQAVLLTHIVTWALTIVAGIFLALRFFAIWYRRVGLVADDVFLAITWLQGREKVGTNPDTNTLQKVLVVFYSTTSSLELALGLGTTTQAINSLSYSSSSLLLLDNVARTLALTTAAWSKSALGISLLGLGRKRRALWALGVVIASVNMEAIGTTLAHWMRCKPVFGAWNDSANGTCWPRRVDSAIQISAQDKLTLGLASAYFAFCDLALVVVGVMLVWSSSLHRGEKVGASVLVALGLMAAAGAIATAVEISFLTDANFTTQNIHILLTAVIDPTLTILASSLPALRLLLPAYDRGRSSPKEFHLIQRQNDDDDMMMSKDIMPNQTPAPLPPPPPPVRPARPLSRHGLVGLVDIPDAALSMKDELSFYSGVGGVAMDQQRKQQQQQQQQRQQQQQQQRYYGGSGESMDYLLPGGGYWYNTYATMTPPVTANTRGFMSPSTGGGRSSNNSWQSDQVTLATPQRSPVTSAPPPPPPPPPPPALTMMTGMYPGHSHAPFGKLTTLEEEEGAASSARPSYVSTPRSSTYSAGNMVRYVEGIMGITTPTTTPTMENRGDDDGSDGRSEQQMQGRRGGGGGGGLGELLRPRDSPTLGQYGLDDEPRPRDLADDYFSRVDVKM
ncbi:hypothetical protein M406DRAFT_74024 [Cryphonectria parasitica EP155]|uniref:Rhodopsin domain-containing protein n=1 Tax=Cryphonectria parasitica (strain ATCC 38755 / EP155) TaxID=660469 RepID=A0A9P4XYM2_CRYP1|nr:uncharacterized protein M406DRAFT_74024 [Cryphonectria parasitica EP155]KAF3763408.1 hypothetical protein M406DRAFT_74024 [Cryphonectria parasitica EP155]